VDFDIIASFLGIYAVRGGGQLASKGERGLFRQPSCNYLLPDIHRVKTWGHRSDRAQSRAFDTTVLAFVVLCSSSVDSPGKWSLISLVCSNTQLRKDGVIRYYPVDLLSSVLAAT